MTRRNQNSFDEKGDIQKKTPVDESKNEELQSADDDQETPPIDESKNEGQHSRSDDQKTAPNDESKNEGLRSRERVKTKDLIRKPIKNYQNHKLYPNDELEKLASKNILSDNLDKTDDAQKESKLEQSLSPTLRNKTHRNTNTLYFLGSLILSIILFLIYILYPSSSSNSTQSNQFDVNLVVDNLKKEFQDQPENTFRVVKSVLKKITKKEASAPGILVLISSKNLIDTNLKFARNVLESVWKQGKYVSIQPNHASNPDQLKKEIDSSIHNNLTENPHQGVLVDNLDQLPFETAMIFHSYCDHENAQFKNTIYVMTVSVGEEIPFASELKYWDTLATKALSSAWKDSNEDQVNSLISRLTGSVAALVDKN